MTSYNILIIFYLGNVRNENVPRSSYQKSDITIELFGSLIHTSRAKTNFIVRNCVYGQLTIRESRTYGPIIRVQSHGKNKDNSMLF